MTGISKKVNEFQARSWTVDKLQIRGRGQNSSFSHRVPMSQSKK